MRRAVGAAAACLFSVVLSVPVGAASARQWTETARLRDWTVTLTYIVDARSEGFSTLRHLRLVGRLHGATRIERNVPLPSACGAIGCQAMGSILEVADLGGGSPTAVLWLWTGGAHCCSVVETVSLARGDLTRHSFGNHGASIVRIGGARLFSSADDRFSYLYTSYAASLNPLQIWAFRQDRFVDVTASYPGLVGRDAVELWKVVRTQVRKREEARGAFAAWAADACRVTSRERVERVAQALAAKGAFSTPAMDAFGPRGARFPVALMRDLTRFGYCRPG
jgi:hypothetical protein